ncbi:NnrU family protein [Jannaschia rubra]|uniref:NnrU family protein n=1 Tax=Jannaschia rubra TaxID=282197 RepID=UPI00248FE567|nr:NnrU family protein [Jannaschia rubra]
MILLAAGVALWSGAHFFKRLAPGARARMGDAGKGVVALALVASIVLMVLGYRSADFVALWYPPPFLVHVNNLLMVLAFYLFGVGAARGITATWLRHPQLTAVSVWAVGHLLVNGDLASVVLFGGLLVWALAEMTVINRSQPWDRPAGSWKGDLKALVIGLVLLVIAAAVHIWLGVNPFGA